MNTYFLIIAISTNEQVVWGPYRDFSIAATMMMEDLPLYFESQETKTLYTTKIIEVFLEEGSWKTLNEKMEIRFESTDIL